MTHTFYKKAFLSRACIAIWQRMLTVLVPSKRDIVVVTKRTCCTQWRVSLSATGFLPSLPRVTMSLFSWGGTGLQIWRPWIGNVILHRDHSEQDSNMLLWNTGPSCHNKSWRFFKLLSGLSSVILWRGEIGTHDFEFMHLPFHRFVNGLKCHFTMTLTI